MSDKIALKRWIMPRIIKRKTKTKEYVRVRGHYRTYYCLRKNYVG